MIVKKNLIIFKKEKDWETIKEDLIRVHGQSTMLISWKCRRELGFSVRYHRGLVPLDTPYNETHQRFRYENQIHLDFFNESAQTFFVLKYKNNDTLFEEDYEV